jgi:hypothetical protein
MGLFVLLFLSVLVNCGAVVELEVVLDAVKNLPTKEVLESLVADCHGGKGSGSTQDCSVALYVTEFMRLKKGLVDPLSVGAKLSRPAAVSDLEGNFASVFEEGMNRGMPFRQAMTSRSNVSAEMCVSDVSTFRDLVDPTTQDVSLRACEDSRRVHFATHVIIPSIAASSYLHRLEPELTESAEGLVDYIQQWPAVVPLPNGARWSVVGQCPLDMHMVVWGAETTVNLRLFLKSVSSKLLPTIGQRENVYPHHVEYGDLSNLGELPKNSEVKLEEKQFVFIPNAYLAQFAMQDREVVDGTLVKMCLVDASNYQVFKRALEVEAMVSAKAAKLLKDMYLPTFRTDMRRDLNELPLSQAFDDANHVNAGAQDGPIDDSKSKRKRRKKGGSFKDWQGVAKWNTMIEALTLPEPPIAKTTDMGRCNATIQWLGNFSPLESDTAVYGYNVTACPRDAKGRFDENECIVTVLERGVGLKEELHVKHSIDEDREIFTLSGAIQGLEPATTYRFNVILVHGLSASNPSPWSDAFTTKALEPPSAIPGKAIAVTGALPLTMTITFPKPFDDGGSNVLGYHVQKRYIDRRDKDLHTHDFLWAGDLKSFRDSRESIATIVLGGMRPNSVVEFRVSPFNAIGSGTHTLTPSVPTGRPGYRYEVAGQSLTTTLYGRGSDQHRPLVTREIDQVSVDDKVAYYKTHPHAHESMLESSSCLLRLSDTLQLLDHAAAFKDESSKSAVKVWTSFWSPKHYDIVSEAIWMNENASIEVLHHELHDRVAVALRDGTSFVAKARMAQAAGAAALIIVDDGSCFEFDQLCVPGADKRRGEYFAAQDLSRQWLQIRIPVVMGMHNESFEFFSNCNLTAPESVQSTQALTVLEQRLGSKLVPADSYYPDVVASSSKASGDEL